MLYTILVALVPFRAAAQNAYLLDGAEGFVGVVNTATNTSVGPLISVGTAGYAGNTAGAIAISPDGTKVYVGTSQVSVISTVSNTVTATVDTASIDGDPGSQWIGVSPDGSRAYLLGPGGALSVLDTSTNTIIKSLFITLPPVGADTSTLSAALSQDGQTLYVVDNNSGKLLAINLTTYAITVTGCSETGGLYVLALPNGNVYLNNDAGTTIVSCNPSTGAETSFKVALLGGPPAGGLNQDMILSPDGTKVYGIGNGNGDIQVIDVATSSVVDTISTNGFAVIAAAFVPGTSTLYGVFLELITIINTATGAVTNINTLIDTAITLGYWEGIVIASGTGVTGVGTAQSGELLGDCACKYGPTHGVFSPAAGDPIDIASGNVHYQTTDYSTAGQNPLAFTRSYNSRGNAPGITTLAASLGVNWRSNYDRYLQIISASQVIAERADGQQLAFTLNGTAWTPNTDVDVTLSNAGTTWTLVDHNDTLEIYTTTATGKAALLNSIKARNGYTQMLSYNAGNQLTSVSDSYSRSLSLAYNGNGTLQTITTPDSTTIAFGYATVTGGVQLTSVTYSTTPATSQTYSYSNSAVPFALTGITDEDGQSYAAWTYDSNGRGLTGQLGAGVNLATVTYNDSNGSRTVTNALGVTDTYTYTTLQGIPKVTGISRAATSTTAAATESMSYDSNGYLASMTDWNGNQTTYVNDSHGDPTTINEAVGTAAARTTTITYDSTFVHLPAQIVTPGLTVSFTYDGSGEVLTRTLTDTTTTSVPYATQGRTQTWTNTWANFLLASTTSPNGNATSFSYDGSGALVKITNALSQSTNITAHTGGGLPQSIVDPNGVTTTLTYSPRQWLLSSAISTGAGVLTTSWAYDAAGNLINTILPDKSNIAETYDTAHRVTAIADALSNSVNYTLDALGDRTQSKTENSAGTVERQHSGTFDALGRLLKDVGGVGQTTQYTFDPNGNILTMTDPLSHVTKQIFDALNRLTTSTDANNGVTTYFYDPHDRPLSVTDPIGATTGYIYDGFGHVIEETSPARGTTVYHYDPDGNLVQKVDARGAVANYAYDALDRVTSVTYPGDAAENVAYAYDQSGHGFGMGRLTSVSDAVGTLSRSYDERGNLLSESRTHGTVTLTTTYTYDAASRIASITYASGLIVAYTRDAAGRIAAMTAQPKAATSPTSLLSKITYEPFGPPTGMAYGNGVAETRTFDLDYRLTALADTGTAKVLSLAYGYDAANNVLSITDGVTSGNSQKFTYDVLNRLITASGGYGSLGYTYDANGNRLTQNPTGTSGASPAMDGLGSLTSLTFNQSGRLASAAAGATQLSQYTYDAFGHRLVEAGSVIPITLYQYDSIGHLLEETNGTGSVQADYLYLGDQPVAEISGGAFYYLHDDHVGTPQIATGSTQNSAWIGNYQPFGALNPLTSQTATLGQDLRLPGQENDVDTGLYHNGFRDYLVNYGRYLQPDPSGLTGGIHPYLYANANPRKYTDRKGLDEEGQSDIYGQTTDLFNQAWDASVRLPATDVSLNNPAPSFSSEEAANDLAALGNFLSFMGGFQTMAGNPQIGLPLSLLGNICNAPKTLLHNDPIDASTDLFIGSLYGLANLGDIKDVFGYPIQLYLDTHPNQK
jgi:RHS repeat-associated protein